MKIASLARAVLSFLPLCLLTAPLASQTALREDVPLAESFLELGSGFAVGSADVDHHGTSRPDSHAPIGVMGDHTHERGEWMLSLRAMRMHMEGMRDGTKSLSSADVLGMGYMVTPTEMDMDMLMLGGMYAPTDSLTLMAMLPWIQSSMDHVTGMGGKFTTESQGLGDTQLAALYQIAGESGDGVHLNLGVSFPTGSITEKDDTPMMMNAKLPYPMQLGTGTVDVLPGITYTGLRGDWSWGAQGTTRFHLGENSEGYRHGNRLDATGWMARRFGDFSTSLRLDFSQWHDFHGFDSDLNPAVVPTADPNLRGGDRLDGLVGVNYYKSSGVLKGHRLALEFGIPLYQSLNGPQLETDWVAILGWQYAF